MLIAVNYFHSDKNQFLC